MYKTSLLLYYVVALESCIVSFFRAVVPLLCQFVEGWLLQVGPDSVFEVNEALWDIELAVQVERFCEEESLAGSHPRQDNVNPIPWSYPAACVRLLLYWS